MRMEKGCIWGMGCGTAWDIFIRRKETWATGGSRGRADSCERDLVSRRLGVDMSRWAVRRQMIAGGARQSVLL